jgi:hypothetical protein
VKRPRRPRHLGETVLAQATLDNGETLVATALALNVPDRELRLPWDRMASATWDDPTLRVVMSGTRETYALVVAKAGVLPEVIRERVQASILVSEHLVLRGDLGARFSARREPAGDSDVRWTVTFDPGLDPQDPELRQLAEQALERLRQTYGV